jgi:hypothetical protein
MKLLDMLAAIIQNMVRMPHAGAMCLLADSGGCSTDELCGAQIAFIQCISKRFRSEP